MAQVGVATKVQGKEKGVASPEAEGGVRDDSLSMGERRTEMTMAWIGKMLEEIVEVGKEIDRSS